MKTRNVCRLAAGLMLGAGSLLVAAQPSMPTAGVSELRVNDLKNPLGIDDPAPRFSWQLHDTHRGAAQTAYEVLVASRPELLQHGKADVWDSGRVSSSEAMRVRYAGSALHPSSRYFWRVQVWGAAAGQYPQSPVAFWETGLMDANAWHAAWIGYETAQESAVRHAPAQWITTPDVQQLDATPGREQRIAFRASATLDRPVRSAALYLTAQDSVSAWINGAQVLAAQPLLPSQQMPWKKFLRVDVKDKLRSGSNLLAMEAVRHGANPSGSAGAAHQEPGPPLIATLMVVYQDGSQQAFASSPGWKTALHPAAGWQQQGFDDSGWKPAVAWGTAAEADRELGHPWIPDSVKQLRHEFTVAAPLKSARIYSTALGAYELFLNGKRVSEDVLAPGWTDYREHVTYQTYDVTSLLNSGSNAIGALLAPGWYSTSLEWQQRPNNYGVTPPALRVQLRIEHADGSVEWVNSGANWQARVSSILKAEIYDGETQDARRDQPGWDKAGFAAQGWKPAILIDPAPTKIEAQEFQPIRVERTVEAVSLHQPKPGVYIYDFGQNLAGVERVRLSGPAGTRVQLRFGEVLNADGTLYTANLRTAKATDDFILNGNGVEEFTPQFTFHGYRYAELTGLPTAPAKAAVVALVVHTAAPFSADLNTGSAMINKLWSNIQWGQRSNFVGVPTDCPQRDERLGWMADAQVFWRAASYNMSLAAFSRKFSADMRGSQGDTPYYGIYAPGTSVEHSGSGAGWSDAGVIIPWTSWLQTGDRSIIDQNWAAMERYLDAIHAANPDGLWKNEGGTPFGDWLSPEGKTDYTLIATAYWAYDVSLMQQMAHATGRTQDEQKYAQAFDQIRAAFQKQFVHADGFIPGADNSASQFGIIDNPNARSSGGDTQTGYVLALHMNLLPQELRAAAARRLVEKIHANHDLLATGFLGTPYLLEELTKAGYSDLAYTLLLNTRYPSWGYMVEHGATTMWERWNGDQMLDQPAMNSYNHYAYGAVGDWIDRYAAGIDATPTDAGFHTVLLHPVFDARLGSLSFHYNSVRGPIRSNWTVKGNQAEWAVELPANTTGWLPLNAEQAGRYRLDGKPLSAGGVIKASQQQGQTGFLLPAGSYHFQVQLH